MAQLSLYTLQVRHRLLGKLQVSLSLPLSLFNISLDLLLTLKCILSLIQSLFKLSLYPGQVVAFVLSSLDIFLSLLAGVSNSPLVLSKLGDHISLVGNFILQCSDLIILISSVLFSRSQSSFKGLNFSLQLSNSRIGLGHLHL